MPRNINGVYSLPAGNPVVPGTLIETTWANPTMADIGNEITQSLPRNGSAGMTGNLILAHDGVLPKEAVTVDQLTNTVATNNSYLPAGAIQYFAFPSIPSGWLLADGSAVSRTTYANLFSVIGTTYGSGNGTTTFNIPDLRGLFIRSADMGRSIDPGRAVGSFQEQANAPHTHAATVTDPGHNHTINDPGHNHSVNNGSHTHGAFQSVHDHTLTIAAHSHGVNDPGHIHHVNIGAGSTGPNSGAQPAALAQGVDTFSSTTGITIANATPTGTANAVQPAVTVNAAASNVTLNAALSAVYNSAALAGVSVTNASSGTEARPKNIALVACIKAFGALQTDGLGTMAFQNKEAVNITGGNGDFDLLRAKNAPVAPTDVVRLADLGGSINTITSSDTQVLLVDNTDPDNPILRPQTNVPFGMVKLNASGTVPPELIEPSGYNYEGTFNALPGLLPVGTFSDGSFYSIDVSGTLNLYHSNGIQSATVVPIGSRIVYLTDSVTLPVPGWYFEPPPVLSGATASQIMFVPGGGITATNVQAAIVELDTEKAPSTASTATGTSFTPAGNIAATNVQAAINELDTEKVSLVTEVGSPANNVVVTALASGTSGSVKVAGVESFRFGADTSGQLAGFRNKLINGGMRVAQRAVTPLVNNTHVYGVVDRFTCFVSSANLISGAAIQGQVAAGSTGKALGINNLNTIGTTGIMMQQRIESASTYGLNGKTVTISGLVYQDTGLSLPFRIGLLKPDTVDTWTSTSAVAPEVPFTVPSGVWTKFSGPFVVPADAASKGLAGYIASDVLGTTTNKSVYLTDFQLEEGSIATPFEQRPVGLELSLCQRYYQIFNSISGGAYPIAAALAETRTPFYFATAMRTDPTITAGTLADVLNISSDSLTSITPSPRGGVYLVVQGAAVGNYYAVRYANTASAEL